MARINLLPWREALRKERQQVFFTTMGVFVVVTIFLWGAVHLVNTQRIEYQETRNQFLNDQIANLDKKIAEIEALEKRKTKIKGAYRSH